MSGRSYWRQYTGHNCTNYVAYRLIKNGASGSYAPGVAATFGSYFSARKVRVDHRPAVGAIAWWGSYREAGIGSAGHVAYVEKVNSNGTFAASEDNYGGNFDWRTYRNSEPSGFIHLKDRPTRPPVVKPVFSAASAPSTAIAYTQKYSYTFRASGSPKFSKASGTTPPGLALSSNGVLSGIPTVRGTYRFAVKATNSAGSTTTKTMSIAVRPRYKTLASSSKLDVAMAPQADGRLTVAAVGSDGNVYTKYQKTVNGSYTDWYAWSDGYSKFPQGTPVAIAPQADGRLTVAAVGSDGNVYTKYQKTVNGSYTDWYAWSDGYSNFPPTAQ